VQLHFIRHGQSYNNALWDATRSDQGRRYDPELTETGQRQAEALAQFLGRPRTLSLPSNPNPTPPLGRDPLNLAGFGLTHIYTSLMQRAVATGAVLAQALGLPLVAWLDLHEGGGLYLDDAVTGEPASLPGPGRSFFEANYPCLQLPDWLDEQGWWLRPYEVRDERPLRARRVLDELLARHANTDDRVAFFSHGGFYNHFLAALLNLPSHDGLWFTLNNTAITRIDFAEELRVVYLNRLDFIPAELVT
jgi:2,3-bisphosphoglycerate-dependent phosphoglycerate mutase